MKKQVSIIIPFYNSASKLKKCLDSIINQTYSNLEIICINDGSKDNTLELLKDYKKKDKRIKLIDKVNDGAAHARNDGLKVAKGDYVIFIDSDDTISLDTIELLVDNIEDNDIIIFGYNQVSKGKVIKTFIPKNDTWSRFKMLATWGKMYKTKYIKKNKISFADVLMGEDVYFNLQAYTNTTKIVSLSKALYNYEMNDTSITHSINKENKVYDYEELIKLINKEIDFSQYNEKEVGFFYLKTITQNIIIQIGNVNNKELKKLYIKNIKLIRKFSKIGFHIQKGEEFKINIIVNMFYLFYKFHILGILLSILKLIYHY